MSTFYSALVRHAALSSTSTSCDCARNDDRPTCAFCYPIGHRFHVSVIVELRGLANSESLAQNGTIGKLL